MFENLGHFFKRMVKQDQKELGSKDAAKERLHLVLMQDRANVSADFLELMKQEIIDVIKKYIVVDESAIDVRLTNQSNDDGTNGAPALYANIPIVNIKNDMMAEKVKEFEGVDFNKEMGLASDEESDNIENNLEETSNKEIENKEENNEVSSIEVIELQPIQEENETKEELVEESKTTIIINNENEYKEIENTYKISDEENEVVEKNDDEQKKENLESEVNDQENEKDEEDVEKLQIDYSDEDDDDDVTFDDLLKAAEEEENENNKKNKK